MIARMASRMVSSLAVMAMAVGAVAATPQVAAAHDYHRHNYRGGGNDGAWIAGAIIGGIAGAMLLSQPRAVYGAPIYRYPPPPPPPTTYYYYRTEPSGYAVGYPAANQGWWSHVNWCSARYRSYDSRSNSFVGYDGYRHVCFSPYYHP